MTDRDRTGILDFLERAFLRGCGAGEQTNGRNRRDYRETHRNPRQIRTIRSGTLMRPGCNEPDLITGFRPIPKQQRENGMAAQMSRKAV